MKASEIHLKQKSLLKAFFNETRNRWHHLYSGDSFIDVHMRERKELVLSVVDAFANNRQLKILDLGCGSGLLAREMSKKGHKVVGADIAYDLVALLDDSLKDHPTENAIGCVISDAGNICLADGCFDMVLCVGVLQYQTDDNVILREISRILKEGGRCIMTVPNLLRINYLLDPLFYLKYIVRRSAIHLRKVFAKPGLIAFKSGLSGKLSSSRPYDKKYFFKDIVRLLAANQFEITKCAPFGYGPFTLFNKNVFNNAFSIKISMKMKLWAQESSSVFLRNTSNRWVFVATKTGPATSCRKESKNHETGFAST